MSVRRADRISAEIQRTLSEILRNDVKDPRINSLCSIIRVEITSDLAYCKAFVTVYGTKEEQKSVFSAIENATPFIRRRLGSMMSLRRLPELRFVFDDSIEYSVHISGLMNKLNEEEHKNDGNG